MAETTPGVTFGVAYYPEQWDRSFWESDAKRMAEMGIKAVRMMEFAWPVIEPKEGKYDFSCFDTMIDILSRHGIKTVLGTPTAGIPAWLFEKDPTLRQVHPSGIVKDFGTRHVACYNNATYLKASEKIVEAIARHFGKNKDVIGWQLDNEIGHEGTDKCVCENCQKEWHLWLKKRYKDIEVLNQIWGTVFWGTRYSNFRQVPVPRQQIQIIQNPGLQLDYDRFCSDSAVQFIEMQAKVLRKHVSSKQWLSTNVYLTPHSSIIDMEEIMHHLDVSGTGNYPVWGDADEPVPYFFMSYYLSYVRGLKKNGNFTVFEQFSGFQGHQCLGYLPPARQIVSWTNQAIALGADKVFYFRWRNLPYGQEQLCYALHDYDNLPTVRSKALSDNIRDRQKDYGTFAGQPYEAEACLVYDKDNSRIVKSQYLTKGLNVTPNEYMQIGYDYELARHFAPYVIFNINADVKSAQSVELAQYKMISLPLYQMADAKFVKRLSEWVKRGGHLILGWRSGTRDEKNWTVPMTLPGLFTEMAGVQVRQFESLNNRKTKIKVGWLPIRFNAENWADILELGTARALAWYADGKKHYNGAPCASVNDYGLGKVYYLGTSLSPEAIFFLYRKIFKDAGLKARFFGNGIEVVKRSTVDGGVVEVVLNHTSMAHRVLGKSVEPYDMMVIKTE
jgi:beta-galactosidase